MTLIDPTKRTTVRRLSDRGRYDRDSIYAILDEALICHLGFVDEGQPFVIPTIHARVDDRLYIHGSRASRMLRCLAERTPACITVTLLDGLVLARSAFHHSMNYRSVIVLATGGEVTDPAEKNQALAALTEHVIAGRWAEARPPSDNELASTSVLSFPLDEASAKVRSGPPKDDEDDYRLPVWAGVIPMALHSGTPIPDARLPADIAPPPYVTSYRRPV